MGAQEEGHSGLGPSLGGGSEAGAQIGHRALGPRRLRSRAQRAAGRPQPGRPAMSSGPEPRTARTPFSIADILGPGMAARGPSAPQLPESSPGPTSPLCALEELTSNAFRGLDGLALQRSEGTAPARSRPGTWPSPHLCPPRSRAPPLCIPAATLICPLPSAHARGPAPPAAHLPSVGSQAPRLPAPRGRAGRSRTERPISPFAVGGAVATERGQKA